MIGTADLPGPALRPWQFPDLDAPADARPSAAAPPPLAVVLVPDPEIHAGQPGDAGHASVVAEPPVEAVRDDQQASREALEREIARGYADGMQRGIVDGRQKGYTEGFSAGTEAARQSLEAEGRRVAAIAACLAGPVRAVERVVEDALVALALELARYVIGSEISRSHDSLVRLIREALAQAPLRVDRLRIALHPADLELVRTAAPELEGGGAVLIGDTAVEAGGCQIFVGGETTPIKDRRWRPRGSEEASQIDLSLAARWRSAMLTLFDGEGK